MFRILLKMVFLVTFTTTAYAQSRELPAVPVSPTPPVAPIPVVASAATAPTPLTIDPALQSTVEQIIADREARKKAEDDAKKAEDSAKALQTGTVVPLNVVWDNGFFFRTPNKDWNIHFGGRLMFEGVWWSQPQNLKGPATSNAGVPGATATAANGVGVLDDGTYFRRVRLKANGTAYKTFEFDFEVNFENLNLITFDHMWVGIKDVPYLGTIRMGNMKVPQGLENWGTDYHQTFIERSALNDAFSTLFAPGILNTNAFFDQRMTYQTMFHRIQPLQYYNGIDFGGGNYAFTGRITALPVYEREGEELVHIGGSYQYRDADLGRTVGSGATPATGSAFGDTTGVVRFRSRADLRDNVGAPISFAGDAGRFVDTGYFQADSVQTFSPELLAIEGPFALQTEATFSKVQNARLLFVNPGKSIGDPTFWGTYAEASYFLTGEHRGYDKRLGTYDRIKVRNNLGPCGWGAWQLAYRFSYLDLNSNGIQGGILQQHTMGVNWYFNDNAKMQFNYTNIHRDIGTPAFNGTTNGFGVLVQYYF